jgi:hypothetical protein
LDRGGAGPYNQGGQNQYGRDGPRVGPPGPTGQYGAPQPPQSQLQQQQQAQLQTQQLLSRETLARVQQQQQQHQQFSADRPVERASLGPSDGSEYDNRGPLGGLHGPTPGAPAWPVTSPNYPGLEDDNLFRMNKYSQYGGTDGGRIHPPSQLSVSDLQDAGILQNNGPSDPGTSVPDPNSRRSMARFQTYLDNTFSKPPGSTPVPSFSTPTSPDSSRLPVPIVPEYGLSGQRNPYYHKSMPEVLDTMTCPLEKILALLGPKGTTMKSIIDISGIYLFIVFLYLLFLLSSFFSFGNIS